MNRIFFSDNGILNDWTKELNSYHVGSKVFNYTTNQDALYIGSRLPFNHIYFKLKELNAVSATMTVQYWNNNWENVVELRDETAGLTQSGFVTFTPDRDSSWTMENESEDVTGLSTVQVYDKYWVKITFNATLTNTTEISWLGQIFCDDYDLGAEYPELTRQNTYMAFQNGKISWEEQCVKASEILSQDLIDKQIIEDKAQILNKEDYKNAAVCKVAELIFNAFGDDYIDQRQRAREEYQLRLSKKIHRVDLNQNAVEDISERKNTSGWLNR
jgi:hypothetical protein